MNTEIEKKWFVYVGDNHQGPFEPKEVHAMREAGTISDDSYVWCEGMADWVMLSQAQELQSELKKIKAPSAPSKGSKVSAPQETPKAVPAKGAKKSSKSRFLVFIPLILIALVMGGLSALSRFAPEELHAKMRPILAKITDTAPITAMFFNSLPRLNDVKPDDYRDLEDARLNLTENGAKIALALAQTDPNRPSFYVSTNLPDRTKFDIIIIGRSETLLNRLQFTAQVSVVTTKGLGKSDPFLADGGQLIPKGDYQVYIMESSDQDPAVRDALAALPNNRTTAKTPAGIPQGTKFLVARTLFLGGDKDETYLTRLKSFHEKIKQNSEHELQELQQYSDTLSAQFNTLTTEFNKVYQAKKPTAPLLANWKKNADTFQQINTQLDQTIQTWSKETLQNEFFYGKVYELVKSAYESLKGLFTLENNYVSQPQEKAAFEIQYGKAMSETRDSIELLRSKMDVITKAPKTPSGLPTREGL